MSSSVDHRSRSTTPHRANSHHGHSSRSRPSYEAEIHATPSSSSATVPMANSYAEPSRLRRIMKSTPPPRPRPASSVAGSISVNGSELGNRHSTGFDPEDRILEDPDVEADADASGNVNGNGNGIADADGNGNENGNGNNQLVSPTLQHHPQLQPQLSQPALQPKKSSSRYSEDLASLSRRQSPSFYDSQTSLPLQPPPKSESHVSVSQMLLNGTRHVSLLKKKSSMRKHGKLGRHHSMTRASASERNSRASSRIRSRSMESIRSYDSLAQRRLEDDMLGLKPPTQPVRHGMKQETDPGFDAQNSAFYVPIPTNGNPTEILALRFQAWRKILKDVIGYFREIQRTYEMRSKLMLSASNVVNNIIVPPTFLTSGGLGDATNVLRDYHRQALVESNKAKEIEAEIIVQLTGLRSDLQHKLKEIKSLSGDFKNSVDKEMEGTKKAVKQLQEALSYVDSDPSAITGKGDPFIIRMSVDRQVERQIEEENYLHMAFLNLETSGRDLESIVVGEIQKAYNAYANILRRDAELALDAANRLKNGPVSLPKDYEWNAFVSSNEHLVDPNLPVRDVANIMYPGKDHPATMEIRSGILERKSKYLKSYTPGWYVLSPTHLHEFRSADKIMLQAPVMSLYLPEQKLGSHSNKDSSSHKFMLKGRQTGSMHRGHAWVFRSDGYDTMLAWYEDIKNLTEKSGEARDKYVRRHGRHMSSGAGSFKASDLSSLRGSRLSVGPESAVREPSPESDLEEDEADKTPYTRRSAVMNPAKLNAYMRAQSTPQSPQDRHMGSSTSSLQVAHGQLTPRSVQTSPHLSSSPTSHPAFMQPIPTSEPNAERGKFGSDVPALHSDIDTSQLATSVSSTDSMPLRGRDREAVLPDDLATPGLGTSPDMPTGASPSDRSLLAMGKPSHSSLMKFDGPPTPSTVDGPSFPESLEAPIHGSDAMLVSGSQAKRSGSQSRTFLGDDGEGTGRSSTDESKSVNVASSSRDPLLEVNITPPRPMKYQHTVPRASLEVDTNTSSSSSPAVPGDTKRESVEAIAGTELLSSEPPTSPTLDQQPASASTGITVSTIPAESSILHSTSDLLSSRTSYDSSFPRASDGTMSPLALAERESVTVKDAVPVAMRTKTAEVVNVGDQANSHKEGVLERKSDEMK